MWTKPTMGAFIYGVVLMLGVTTVWSIRQSKGLSLPPRLRSRLEITLTAGIVSIPLGAVWYIRNLLLGQDIIVLPDSFWQTLAARSGLEFGWPLLAALILSGWVYWRWRDDKRTNAYTDVPLYLRWMITGLALMLVGLLPSIYNAGRIGITENRMGLVEWLASGAGTIILFRTLWDYAHPRWTDEGRAIASKIGWMVLLALPYFVTWFYSYSYHYRLSFAIVPLMMMPIAVILARLKPQWNETAGTMRIMRIVSLPKTACVAGIVVLAIPGIIAPLYDGNAGWDWLWTDKLPDDTARYRSGNQALMAVVDGLQVYHEENPGKPLHVVAPGIRRLPFFFPLDDIQVNQRPTRLSELKGATYFIYGKPETGGDFNTFTPGTNQVLAALSLATDDPTDTRTPIRRAWWYDDGIFKYTVYEVHLENRFKQSFINAPVTEGDVIFGGFARLLGHDIGDLSFWPGRRLIMHLYWQVIEQPQADYTVYIHLRDPDGTVVKAWDGPVTWTNDGNYYSTLVWEPGEYVVDERQLIFDNPEAPLQADYRIVVGLYDPVTETRVPMTLNEQAAGNGYTLPEKIAIVAEAPQ
jgi:hypothetical protein